MFECDYYDYEKHDALSEEINRFRGEHMNQYSWGELTLARLHWNKNKD